MAGNRGVAYLSPGKVEVRDLEYPTLEVKEGPGVDPADVGRLVRHAAILRTVASGICESDWSLVRGGGGHAGLVLGHEITGEVVEVGPGVEFIRVGDLCSVPSELGCGRCRNCKHGLHGVCLNRQPYSPHGRYVGDIGGGVGGQAEYVRVPYADWNLLKFPDKDRAMDKILDLALLADTFPTGYHGCVMAGVKPGLSVYISGARSVGLAAAASAFLLGAAKVIVADIYEDRLAHARSFGCDTVNVGQVDPSDQLVEILGIPEVDCVVETVGFEAPYLDGDRPTNFRATILNSAMEIAMAGSSIGIPGLYITDDPAAENEVARADLSVRIGLGWAKSQSFAMGQCPVMKYNRHLMQAILGDRVQIAKAVNVIPISLDQAPHSYTALDSNLPGRYMILDLPIRVSAYFEDDSERERVMDALVDTEIYANVVEGTLRMSRIEDLAATGIVVEVLSESVGAVRAYADEDGSEPAEVDEADAAAIEYLRDASKHAHLPLADKRGEWTPVAEGEDSDPEMASEAADIPDEEAYRIRIAGPITQGQRLEFARLGIDIAAFEVPNFYRTILNREQVLRVRDLPYVIDVTPYEVEDTVSQQVIDLVKEELHLGPELSGDRDKPSRMFDLLLHRERDLPAIRQLIEDLPSADVVGSSNLRVRFSSTSYLPTLAALANRVEIHRLDLYEPPEI